LARATCEEEEEEEEEEEVYGQGVKEAQQLPI
jgi:hypothetical protein